jgi:hypothetical protein
VSDILQELQDRLDAGDIWTKATAVACGCKHYEYCDDCLPKEIREGGKYFGMRFSFDRSDISLAIAEIERLRAEAERLKAALNRVVETVPCYHEGNFIVEHHGIDGEYLGTQNIDPLWVIEEMASVANNALAAAPQPPTTEPGK